MAIYGLRAHIVSRKQGHSAVAAAAYRARADLLDQRTGLSHDYRKAFGGGDLLFAGLFVPHDAPDWARDREALWNAAEAQETRKDSRVARDFQLDLPHELTPEQNRYLVQDWVKEVFTRKGYAADVAIHKAHSYGDARNVHAHILVPTRTIDADGFAASKDDDLNSTAQLQAWRASWAKHLAHHLARYGFDEQAERMAVGHLRLDRQREAALKRGDLDWAEQLDRAPQMHYGKAAAAMERRGVATDKGDINRAAAAAFEERSALHPTQSSAAHPETSDGATAGIPSGAYAAMQPTHAAVFADREAEQAAVRAAIKASWQTSQGDALDFAIGLGDRGLTLAETKRGRFVAVDSRGDWHKLDPDSLGATDAEVQARLRASFGTESDVRLPKTAELRDAIRAEQAAWWGGQGPRVAAYADLDAARIADRQAWLSDRAEFRSQVIVEQRAKLAEHRSVQALHAAWEDVTQAVDLDRTFADALRERGLILARVTDADAVQSRTEQITEQLTGGKRRAAWEEGSFAAVDRFGTAWRLDATTLPAEAAEIAEQLAYTAERAGVLPSLANARLFQDEQRLQQRDDRQEMQRQARAAKLGELEDVQQLRAAWQRTETMSAFSEAIEEQGFVIGRATIADAARSRYDATVAQSHDGARHLPVFDVGELVAFSGRGWAYRLNAATLDDLTVDRRMAGSDVPLPDFTEAREIAWQLAPTPQARHVGAQVPWGRFGDAAGKFDTVAVSVMQDGANLIEGLFGFIDRFCFGSTQAPPEPPLKARMNEGDLYRQKLNAMEPQVRRKDPDLPRHIYGVDPEILEDIRRAREAEQHRERERRRGR